MIDLEVTGERRDEAETRVRDSYGESLQYPELDSYMADMLSGLEAFDGDALFGALREDLNWSANKFKHHYREKLCDTHYVYHELEVVDGRDERRFHLTREGVTALQLYRANNCEEIKPDHRKPRTLTHADWNEAMNDHEAFVKFQENAELALWVLYEWFTHLHDEEVWGKVVQGARERREMDAAMPPLPEPEEQAQYQ